MSVVGSVSQNGILGGEGREGRRKERGDERRKEKGEERGRDEKRDRK